MNRLLNWLQTRRRTLLWACAALCLYALLGFLFLPWFAGRQLTDLLERHLALDLQAAGFDVSVVEQNGVSVFRCCRPCQ